MAYITTSDVVAAAPGLDISATSRPSSAQVNDMIASEETSLNATLAGYGYETPIVGPLALAVVKKIVTHKVLAGVLRAKAYGKSNPRDVGADTADKVADSILMRLADPDDDFRLVDAIVIEDNKGQSVEGADALEGQTSVDYESPITRYTRF